MRSIRLGVLPSVPLSLPVGQIPASTRINYLEFLRPLARWVGDCPSVPEKGPSPKRVVPSVPEKGRVRQSGHVLSDGTSLANDKFYFDGTASRRNANGVLAPLSRLISPAGQTCRRRSPSRQVTGSTERK